MAGTEATVVQMEGRAIAQLTGIQPNPLTRADSLRSVITFFVDWGDWGDRP
ncbi:MAG: hypothetical protein VKJ64_09500 [Leptolyngbyaceae bacterium]|nr:hypothetical protein [Leptolyngbyaceae bacterium]